MTDNASDFVPGYEAPRAEVIGAIVPGSTMQEAIAAAQPPANQRELLQADAKEDAEQRAVGAFEAVMRRIPLELVMVALDVLEQIEKLTDDELLPGLAHIQHGMRTFPDGGDETDLPVPPTGAPQEPAAAPEEPVEVYHPANPCFGRW